MLKVKRAKSIVASVISGLLAVSAMVAMGSHGVSADDLTVSGRAFVDYGRTGEWVEGGALSVTSDPLAKVQILAFDADGTRVGSVESGPDGNYTLNIAGAVSSDIRLEATPPEGYRPTEVLPTGEPTGDVIRFIDATTTNTDVDFGFVKGADGLPDPKFVVPVMHGEGISGINGGTSPLGGPADKASLLAFTAFGGTTKVAEQRTTGTVWGTASYTRSVKLGGPEWVFSSAYLKRHATMSPDGLGSIYLTEISSGAANAEKVADIPNANGSGVARSVGLNDSGYQTYMASDLDIPPSAIGRTGLGDLDINETQDMLYVTNLYERSIYQIPVAPGATPTLGEPTKLASFNLDSFLSLCDDDNKVPFGMDFHDGKLYTAVTCVGPAKGDLAVEIKSFDPETSVWSPETGFKLDYAQPSGAYHQTTPDATYVPGWHPWNDRFAAIWGPAKVARSSGLQIDHGQPVASDITIGVDGRAVVSIMDRLGDIVGYQAFGRCAVDDPVVGEKGYERCFDDVGNPVATAGNPVVRTVNRPKSSPYSYNEGIFSKTGDGDQILFDIDANGDWVPRTSPAVDRQPSLGGLEFLQDGYTNPNFPIKSDKNNEHGEQTLGSSEEIPGIDLSYTGHFKHYNSRQIMANDLENGDLVLRQNGYETDAIVSEGLTGFGKAGGLGELSRVVKEAPIWVGNRVWFDADKDGFQDSDLDVEYPVPGVTITLYKVIDGVKQEPRTETTDDNGYFQFEVDPYSTYTIEYGSVADYATGPLKGWTMTKPNAPGVAEAAYMPDHIDSDAVAGGDKIGRETFNTGAPGQNDFTHDAGFNVTPPPTTTTTTTTTTTLPPPTTTTTTTTTTTVPIEVLPPTTPAPTTTTTTTTTVPIGVLPPAPPAPTLPPPELNPVPDLPETGANASVMISVALLLLASGVGTTLFARRRRRTTEV